MRVVVGLAGQRGSGKTTIARRLVEQHGFAQTSFGDTVRAEARARGLEANTPDLQELGLTLIREWGWDRLAASVLANIDPSKHLVIDGVRHREIATTLRQLVEPAKFILVYVDVDEDQRLQRLAAREQKLVDLRLDTHPVEQDVAGLRHVADLIVQGKDDNAANSIAEAVARLSNA